MDDSDTSTDSISNQVDVRRAKRASLIDSGIDPYPRLVPRTHTLRVIRDEHSGLAVDTHTGQIVDVAGRVIFVRNSGKLCFATIRDGSDAELQIMFSLGELGPEELDTWKTVADIGDHISVHGEVITSRRGELSILAQSWQVASKALRPIPAKSRGLSEENRVRQRYLDLIVRPEARRVARLRANAVRAVRAFFHGRDFIELETPMLQNMHGGAAARPFVTHANAWDEDLYLRIAPELFLKRSVVGGLERVFEVNRNFRNEGVDSTHSPEFSMLEAYEAYGTYDSMADLTRTLIQSVAGELLGSMIVEHPDGTTTDLSGEWRTVTLHQAVGAQVDAAISPDTSLAELREVAETHDVAIKAEWSCGEIVLELFEKLVEHTLLEPTFVRDFPVEVRPLTAPHRDDARLTESWDLIVFGTELATAYSELVDPVVQRERLEDQSRRAAAGDPDAMQLDEDFLEALEYGMPPSGGMGMGVDRLLMALTGLGIRETILFPLTRRAR